MNIVLFGVKHCGKTTVGQILAEKMQATCCDLDQLILQQQTDMTSISQLFHTIGRELFSQLETSLLQTYDWPSPCVLSLGGSTLLSSHNVRLAEKIGQLVHLSISLNTLQQRLEALPQWPAFIDPQQPQASIAQYYESRHTPYCAIHDSLQIDADQHSAEQLANRILEQL